MFVSFVLGSAVPVPLVGWGGRCENYSHYSSFTHNIGGRVVKFADEDRFGIYSGPHLKNICLFIMWNMIINNLFRII